MFETKNTTNGLSKIGNKYVLGGTLTGDTQFDWNGGNSTLTLNVTDTSNIGFFDYYIEDPVDGGYSELSVGINYVYLETYNALNQLDSFIDLANNGIIQLASTKGFELASSDTPINAAFKGAYYEQDYSAYFTSRSLVDKGYVTGLTSTLGVGTITGGTNGLNNQGSVIKLGGSLSESTTISFDTYDLTFIDTYEDSYIYLKTGIVSMSAVDSTGNNEISTFSLDPALNKISINSGAAYSPNFKGLVYEYDYSSSFTSRSLVDKGYLTGNTYLNNINTDIKLITSGNGIYLKEGGNATMGVRALTGGTAIVSTSKVTASSRIFLTSQGGGSNHGAHYISARIAGVLFTISSTNVLDTDSIAWMIIEPS